MEKLQCISVIIPTLNEEHGIAQTLYAVQAKDVEVIVVDGGSRDDTCVIAQKMGAMVLHSESGRGKQMNHGAQQASGDIVLFLHADTELPVDYAQDIRQCLQKTKVVAGAFCLQLTGQKKGLSLISWGANIRSKYLGLVYGDQGLFLKREMFLAVGGYPQTPLMEDVMLVQQLRKKGRIGLVDAEVKSSGRRWEKYGLWCPSLLNQIIILGFFLGLSPDFLAKVYGVGQEV